MNIEQRALEKYPVSIVDVPDIDEGCPSFYTEDENAIKRHYYIEGATEQKAIDDKERVVRMLKQTIKHGKEKEAIIDKACEWLTEHTFGSDYDCLADATSTTILYHGQELLATEFRKAMEDKGPKDATQWIADNEFILAHQEENDRLVKATLRLMDYMEAHHLSESDIADIVGVSEKFVHKLLHGQLNNEIIKLGE